MKKLKTKLFKKIFKKTAFKNTLTPSKVFYIWDRNNLTKVETFSI